MIPDPRPYATLHAAERAWQRLGRAVTRSEWMGAILLITERAARCVQDNPDGSETWLVRLGFDEVEVIWKPRDGVIVTIAQPVVPRDRARPRDRRDWRHGDRP